MSGRYGIQYQRQKLREALEGVFAEACLPGYECREEAEKVCFERASELYELVKEMVDVYVVAAEWGCAGSQRAYLVPIRIDSKGIRKERKEEWHLVKSEEAAPQPHSLLLRKVHIFLRHISLRRLCGWF